MRGCHRTASMHLREGVGREGKEGDCSLEGGGGG